MTLEIKQDSTLDRNERNNYSVPAIEIDSDTLYEMTHGGMASLEIDGKRVAVIWTSEQF